MGKKHLKQDKSKKKKISAAKTMWKCTITTEAKGKNIPAARLDSFHSVPLD